jgi:phosphoglycolate phosphatase
MSMRRGPILGAAFDLDGTLIDSAPDLVAAAQEALRVLGAPGLPAARIVSFIGGGIAVLVERTVTASLMQVPEPEVLAAATGAFRQHYAVHLFERSRVYPGVRETLERLQARGIRRCCVTNKAAEFAVPLLTAAGLDTVLEFSLSPGSAAERKPGPALLQQACARFEVGSSELMMVGDSDADLGAARAAGCPVLLVRYGYGHGLAGLGPDGFIDRLPELEAWVFGQR